MSPPTPGRRRPYDQRRGEHRTTLSISTSPAVITRFKTLAKMYRCSVSELGRSALMGYLENHSRIHNMPPIPD